MLGDPLGAIQLLPWAVLRPNMGPTRGVVAPKVALLPASAAKPAPVLVDRVGVGTGADFGAVGTAVRLPNCAGCPKPPMELEGKPAPVVAAGLPDHLNEVEPLPAPTAGAPANAN